VRRALLLPLLASCTSSVDVPVALAPDDEVLIVAFLDDLGRPRRLAGPYFLEGDAGPVLQSFALQEREAQMVWGRTSFDALAASFPGFDRTRASQITLSLEALELGLRVDADPIAAREVGTLPTATYGLVDVEEGGWSALPADDDRVVTLTALVRMSVPVDTEHCRNPVTDELEVFGTHVDSVSDYVAAIAVLDPDRVVIVASAGLFVLERGGTTQRAAGRYLSVADVGLNAEEVFFNSIDVVTSSVGHRVMATAVRLVSGDGDTGFVVEARVDGQGALTGARLVAEYERTRVRGGAFDLDGRYAVLADRGKLFFEPTSGAALAGTDIPIPAEFLEGSQSRRIIATSDPERPWLFATHDRIHAFDGTTFTNWTIAERETEVVNVWGLTAFDESGRAWAGATDGTMFFYDGTNWGDFDFLPAPRYLECASDGTIERPIYAAETLDLERVDGLLYMVARSCTGLLTIDVETGCTAVVTRPGEASPVRNSEAIFTITVEGDHLYAGSEDGKVYTMRVR
jgi:hypothetical protein